LADKNLINEKELEIKEIKIKELIAGNKLLQSKQLNLQNFKDASYLRITN